MWDFIVRVVCERDCEDSMQLKTKEIFTSSSRVAFLQSEACAQHMIGMWGVMADGDNWFSQVSRE